MKPCTGTFLALLALQFVHAEVALQGVLKNGDTLLFSLSDSQAKTSRWVALGAEFSGFSLEGYNSEQGVLTLKKDRDEVYLSLRNAHVGKAENLARELSEITDVELAELGFSRVKAGDSAWKIAQAAQISLATLNALNPGLIFSRLKVGQIVIVAEPKEPNQPPDPTPTGGAGHL